MIKNLWILIHDSQMNTFENKHIANYLKKENIDHIKIMNIKRINMVVDQEKFACFYDGEKVKFPDKVYPKIGCSLDSYDYDILRTFEIYGVKVINKPDLLMLSQNKFILSSLLMQNDFKSIKSMNMTGGNSSIEMIEKNFSYPLVIKSKIGSLGIGIYLIKNHHELSNITEQINLLDKNYNYLIQEYIPEGNSSLRVVVFDGEIQYVVRQTSHNDFRSNYSRGSEVEYLEVNELLKKYINNIYKILPMNIMGIDLFEIGNDYIICEINSNPGYKSFNASYNEDFTEYLVAYLDKK